MKNPEISIIIPVYKAEAYLSRCIDSIITQTFTDWELLLINDGSPDRSETICKDYAKKDIRIRVFNKPNEGVASARELGIQHANGKYSIHIDPDDWVEKDFLEALYYKALEKNTDMTMCDFIMEYGHSRQIDSQKPSMNPHEFLYQLLNQNRHSSLCNKLIKTELYHRYQLHFPTEMICWEDLYICCTMLIKGCSIDYVPKALYHYDFHSNSNSMVRKVTLKGLKAQIQCCSLIQQELPLKKQYMLNETKGMILITAFKNQILSEQEICTLYPEINNWYILKYGKDYENIYYYGLTLILKGHKQKQVIKRIKIIHFFMRIRRKIYQFFLIK